jgi:Protein of unknown function (DUF4232)
MNDERFDQDLRAVLEEDAPREVPDDLRRWVAAIPATHDVTSRPSRPFWRHPVPLWVGALAALALVLVVGFRWFGPAEQGVGGDPSPSFSTLPSPSHSASAAAGLCESVDLAGRILGWQGAAGSRIADIEIRNSATRPCLVRGTPGLQLIDGRGAVLIDPAGAGPSGDPHVAPSDPKFELEPGGRLRTEVRASNYCGPTPPPPIEIALVLPAGGGRFLVMPATGVSSADAVPPCLGSDEGAIEMNGWRRP